MSAPVARAREILKGVLRTGSMKAIKEQDATLAALLAIAEAARPFESPLIEFASQGVLNDGPACVRRLREALAGLAAAVGGEA